MLLATPGDQHDMAVGSNFGDCPEFLDLVGIGLAGGGWMETLGAWSRMRTVLADNKYDRLTHPKSVLHVC